jgi:hypothetical protein
MDTAKLARELFATLDVVPKDPAHNALADMLTAVFRDCAVRWTDDELRDLIRERQLRLDKPRKETS